MVNDACFSASGRQSAFASTLNTHRFDLRPDPVFSSEKRCRFQWAVILQIFINRD